MRSARAAITGLVAALALVLIPAAGHLAAASPSPADLPADVDVYIDADFVTPDARPGASIQLGYSFWNSTTHEFAPVDGVYALLHPRTGRANASVAEIEADFPGHVLATFEVPQGRPGKVEIGIERDGVRHPIKLAGSGPPSGVPAAELFGATIRPLVGDTVIDRPATVRVDVAARGLWDVTSLTFPEQVIVVARRPDGTELASGTLVAPLREGLPYTGRVTIPELGDVELDVELPTDAGNVVLPGPTMPRTVIVPGLYDGVARSNAPSAQPVAARAPGPTAGSDQPDGIPGIVWIAVGVVVIGAIGYVVLARVLDY